MITSNLIKIKFTTDIDEIEKELFLLGIEPLRWAVVKVSETELTISVSYEENK